MKLFKKIFLLVFILLIIFVANIFISTGYFRTIEYHFNGTIEKKIAIPGAEDITISHSDKFAIISSSDRKKHRDEGKIEGALYLLDLTSTDFKTIPLTTLRTDFGPHGISMIKMDSIYKIMAINHNSQGHSIEVFHLRGERLSHIETLTHESMVSPNDVVMIDEKRFYFTNDHKYTQGLGKLTEDYLGRSLSNVIYFNGESYREVAKGIAYANGINYDTKRDLMFVASPRKFFIKVYGVNKNGSLEFIENIKCKTGVDNLEFDEFGNIWSGAHPNLLQFTGYAAGNKEIAPSEIIKIDYKGKGDFSVESIYTEDGSIMSGSTVAAPYGNLLLVGNVMDKEFLILKKRP